jgi:serine/threonine-protein kinase RsbT
MSALIEVRSRRQMRIASEDDVVLIRRAVRDLATARGFGTFVTAAVTTATSELTRNVFVHGGGGTALIEEVEDGPKMGIRVEFVDRGPGIADLERALRGGHSTKNSLGLGLSGSKRLVDSFQIESSAGQGTKVVIIKWAHF